MEDHIALLNGDLGDASGPGASGLGSASVGETPDQALQPPIAGMLIAARSASQRIDNVLGNWADANCTDAEAMSAVRNNMQIIDEFLFEPSPAWIDISLAIPKPELATVLEVRDAEGNVGLAEPCWYPFSMVDGKCVRTQPQWGGFAVRANSDLTPSVQLPITHWRPLVELP